MEAISYTKARNEFSGIMQRVCEDHDPVIITRQQKQAVVMMSLEDYNALEETLYLLKSPKNAAQLHQAISDLNESKNYTKVKIK